jgi:hypothetical protein
VWRSGGGGHRGEQQWCVCARQTRQCRVAKAVRDDLGIVQLVAACPLWLFHVGDTVTPQQQPMEAATTQPGVR